MSRFASLYPIEHSLGGGTGEERPVGQQAHAKPLVVAPKTWFEKRLKILAGRNLIAEDIPLWPQPLGGPRQRSAQ